MGMFQREVFIPSMSRSRNHMALQIELVTALQALV
jgi:hypothetical protein